MSGTDHGPGAGAPEFRSGLALLEDEITPIELLRRIRKLESDHARLQRWMQRHEGAIRALERKG